MNNYELHMKVHTCHDNCQNPICIAVRKAVEVEREECAKLADIGGDGEDPFCCLPVAKEIAKAIRARGQG